MPDPEIATLHPTSPPALVAESGGSYAAALGIDLAGSQPDEIYKWFLAAVLYGARIPESVATRAWREFARSGIVTPQGVVETGWDGLVAMLDRGGYARYDYKTATKLLDINRALIADYAGDLNRLHAAAADAADLEQRLMALGKGIGEVTTGIFLRELRGRWEKSAPALSPLALQAALALGYVKGDTEDPLAELKRLWREQGGTDMDFVDFEAALVRRGLKLRRRATRDRQIKPGQPPP